MCDFQEYLIVSLLGMVIMALIAFSAIWPRR